MADDYRYSVALRYSTVQIRVARFYIGAKSGQEERFVCGTYALENRENKSV